MSGNTTKTSPLLSRRTFIASAGALGVMSFIGISPLRALAAAKKINATLASGSAGYTWSLSFVADLGGYWDKNGVTLNTADFPSGRDSMQALLAGSAQFSTTTDTPVVFSALSGLKPKILLNFSRYSHDMKIVALKDNGIDINDPSSLKGKRVGTPFGTSGQYVLARYLDYAGLKLKDVQQINIAPADLIGALLHKDIDAFSWTLSASNAAVKQSAGRAAPLTQTGFEKFFRSHQLLLTNEQTIANQPELLEKAVHAFIAAEKHIKTDPSWPNLIAARVHTDVNEIVESTKTYEFKVLFEESFLDDLVKEAEWAIESGLSKRPEGDLRHLLRSLIHDAPLRKIAPERVTLI